jgi:hypothetical protein
VYCPSSHNSGAGWTLGIDRTTDEIAGALGVSVISVFGWVK